MKTFSGVAAYTNLLSFGLVAEGRKSDPKHIRIGSRKTLDDSLRKNVTSRIFESSFDWIQTWNWMINLLGVILCIETNKFSANAIILHFLVQQCAAVNCVAGRMISTVDGGCCAHVHRPPAYKREAAPRDDDQTQSRPTPSSHARTHLSASCILNRKKMKESLGNNVKSTASNNKTNNNNNRLCVTVLGSTAVGKTGSLNWIILAPSLDCFKHLIIYYSVDSSVPDESIHRRLFLRDRHDLPALFRLHGRIAENQRRHSRHFTAVPQWRKSSSSPTFWIWKKS